MSALTDPIVIVAARRTPIGSLQGQFFRPVCAPARRHRHRRCGGAGGCQGRGNQRSHHRLRAPCRAGPGARQAVLGAGLPKALPCSTLNKVCGSGMKAAMPAHDPIVAGSAHIVLAGGMESMTNALYLLPKRGGFRLGHQKVLDHRRGQGLCDGGGGCVRILKILSTLSCSRS